MAGAAVRAAERGPARLARAMRRAPLAPIRARPASQAPPSPKAHRMPKATTTPAIMIAAAKGVGAVTTASPARAMAARPAPMISTPQPNRVGRSWRNRVAGEVRRARARGPSAKAAAESRPKAPAFRSGMG